MTPFFRYGLFTLLFLLLAGCADNPPPPPAPPPPPPTQLMLRIQADESINPDASGKPAPVLLRIYELKEQTAFTGADFFTLFEKDSATLGAALLKKQEFFIKPGDNKALNIQTDPATTQIAVFAAFRVLDTAQWRAVYELAAHQQNNVAATITGNSLKLGPITP